MNHHPVMTWYDVTLQFAGTAGTVKKQIKHIIIVIMHGPQGIRKKEIWQILTNTIILSGFVIYVSFPYRYNDIHVQCTLRSWNLTSSLYCCWTLFLLFLPCPKICFHHPTCWVNSTLIKLIILSDTSSRALIDDRMRHLIKVFILSCLLSQGLLKSLPAGLETVSVSKTPEPEWETKITGERKEIVERKKMSGRGGKVFSFQDTLDNLGWGNILWFSSPQLVMWVVRYRF